jgi:hypothetical protein
MTMGLAGAYDRIGIDARINNRPVHLAFDTGANHSVLIPHTVRRLGLKTNEMGFTEECTLAVGKTSQRTMFGVLDSPAYIPWDIDGLFSWTAVSNHVFQLDVERGVCCLSDELPVDLAGWARWRLVTNSPVVMFECSNDVEVVRIGIDTGSPDGVMLSPERWRKWRAAHAGKPSTLANRWGAGEDLCVSEVLRARRIELGGLMLDDVPVSAATASFHRVFRDSDAILGLYTFRQLKLVIDGRSGTLYVSRIEYPSGHYDYNRAGAEFVPKDPDTSDDIVAHVVGGGPAYRAGIRDGDILLRIGGVDATKWRTIWAKMRHTGPGQLEGEPGTKMKCVLKRNGRRYETTVTLEELPMVN